MIFLTRFDGTEVVVNSDLIVTVEKIPDTVVTLTTGDRIMVKEPVDEVVARAATYRHRVMQGPGVRADAHDLAASLAASSGPIFDPGLREDPALRDSTLRMVIGIEVPERPHPGAEPAGDPVADRGHDPDHDQKHDQDHDIGKGP